MQEIDKKFYDKIKQVWDPIFLDPYHEDLDKLFYLIPSLDRIRVKKYKNAFASGEYAQCILTPSESWVVHQRTAPSATTFIYGIEKNLLSDPYIWSLDHEDFFVSALNDFSNQQQQNKICHILSPESVRQQ